MPDMHLKVYHLMDGGNLDEFGILKFVLLVIVDVLASSLFLKLRMMILVV